MPQEFAVENERVDKNAAAAVAAAEEAGVAETDRDDTEDPQSDVAADGWWRVHHDCFDCLRHVDGVSFHHRR